MLNVLQEKTTETKLNFELDFQNNELYTLQELTRCAALLNYINFNGRTTFNSQFTANRVDFVYDKYLQIADPLGIFIDNFEQFFTMYMNSKYGNGNFRLYIKTSEKSPVAYPISVFEDGMCIFMQYNKCELRKYVYNIMTMFYYYTGQNFYEMISPNINKIPRPNLFDDMRDGNGRQGISNTIPATKTTTDKLCYLNQRNINLTKPYFTQNITTSIQPGLPTNQYFERCIINTLPSKREYEEIVIGSIRKPIVTKQSISSHNEIIVPTTNCNEYGNPDNSKIFLLSEHLNRSRDFRPAAMLQGDKDNSNVYTDDVQFKRKTFVQTNFSKVWSNENKRELVALSIINSVMSVCVQRITYSLLQAPCNNVDNCVNYKNDTIDCNDKLFTCIQNTNDCSNSFINASAFDGSSYNSSGIKNTNQSSVKLIKIPKPTLEVVFRRRNAHSNNNALNANKRNCPSIIFS